MKPIFCFMALLCLFRTGRNEVTRVRGGELTRGRRRELTRVRGGELTRGRSYEVTKGRRGEDIYQITNLCVRVFLRSCVRVLSSLWLGVQSELLPFSKG